MPGAGVTPVSVVQPIADRRRSLRARLAVPVTITVGANLVDAVGADLSVGGLRLVAARGVEVGQEVSLVFFLGGDIVSARATVQWCARTPRGLATFGIRFTAIEDDGPSLVAGYCHASLS